jgi:hypothetical protein
MKSSIVLIGLAMAGFGTAALADQHGAKTGRMASCNKEAADRKGDERKAFMKECLSTKLAAAETTGSAAGVTPQQQRMKTCNAEAKGKTGDERKAFMKQCLSNKS